MSVEVVIPTRMRLDSAAVRDDPDTIIGAFEAAFGRALNRSRITLTAHALDAASASLQIPTVTWSGNGLDQLSALHLSDLESAIHRTIARAIAAGAIGVNGPLPGLRPARPVPQPFAPRLAATTADAPQFGVNEQVADASLTPLASNDVSNEIETLDQRFDLESIEAELQPASLIDTTGSANDLGFGELPFVAPDEPTPLLSELVQEVEEALLEAQAAGIDLGELALFPDPEDLPDVVAGPVLPLENDLTAADEAVIELQPAQAASASGAFEATDSNSDDERDREIALAEIEDFIGRLSEEDAAAAARLIIALLRIGDTPDILAVLDLALVDGTEFAIALLDQLGTELERAEREAEGSFDAE